jgi:hypothetical protein
VNDHKACLLNDDGDGTFTVVGYDMKQNAPVVVSRNPKSGSSTKPTTGIATVDAGEPEASQDAESAIVANDATSASDSAVPFFFTPSGRSYTTYPGMFLQYDRVQLSKSLTFGSLKTMGGVRSESSSQTATNALLLLRRSPGSVP